MLPRAGLRVTYLGLGLPRPSLAQAVHSTHPDAVVAAHSPTRTSDAILTS